MRYVEPALRLVVTAALLVCLVELGMSLHVAEPLLWLGGVVVCLVPTLYLWKRCLDRLELGDDRVRSTPDRPHQPQQTAEAQFAAWPRSNSSSQTRPARAEDEDEGPLYGG